MRRRAENRGADSRAARKVETGKRVKGSGLVLPTFAEGRKYLLLTTSAVLVLKESTVFDQIATVPRLFGGN